MSTGDKYICSPKSRPADPDASKKDEDDGVGWFSLALLPNEGVAGGPALEFVLDDELGAGKVEGFEGSLKKSEGEKVSGLLPV